MIEQTPPYNTLAADCCFGRHVGPPSRAVELARTLRPPQKFNEILRTTRVLNPAAQQAYYFLFALFPAR